MPVINAQTIGNAYPASPGTGTNALGGVWNSRGGWFSITGASAYVQLQYGDLANGHWTEEILLGNGAFVVVPPNCRGMQFRNAVANVVATVTAQIAEGDEPPLAISSFGQIGIVSVASLNFQRNDVAVATEPTADFMDAAGVLTWTLADDVANTRVRITPAFTSPALFPGSVGVGGNAGDTAISRAAAGVLGVTTAFTTGPTSAAAGGGGTAGVYVGASISQVAAAAGTTVQASSVTTDTQPRYAQTAAGTITWGAGGASAQDTTLARVGAGVLQVGTTTQAGRVATVTAATTGLAFSTSVTTDATARWFAQGDGTLKWGDGTNPVDASLGRLAAGVIGSTSTWLSTGPTSLGAGSAAGGWAFDNTGNSVSVGASNQTPLRFTVTGDSNYRFSVQSNGSMAWGPGSTVADIAWGRTAVGQWEMTTASGTASRGFGYGTGTGGAVTQLTSFNTGVTLNAPTGVITLFTSATVAGTVSEFTVTNNAVGATDVIILSWGTGVNTGALLSVSNVASGSFKVTWEAVSSQASSARTINFAVIKGASA